jgi:diguanylate cyclase (GGDEF)-like protein
MMAQGEALGLLHLESSASEAEADALEPFELLDSKERLAHTVAEHIALAFANLRLRETLRVQSVRDPLTGLFNRRYMEESLERELRRSARHRRSLGVLLLDLDHFKTFNDTFGHGAGDILLRELGHFLQGNVRGEDISCRYGGEEFALILPDAPLDSTLQRAEQLREQVRQLQVTHHGRALGAVSVSIGVAVYPQHGGSAEELLAAADRALYQAKAGGRNRVELAGRLLAHSSHDASTATA